MHCSNVKKMSTLRRVVDTIEDYWRVLFGLGVPLIFSPLIFISNIDDTKTSPVTVQDNVQAAMAIRCCYVLIVMGLFWLTEVIPVAVTALIPVVAFPLLGIMSTGETSSSYIKANSLMFVGGLIIAIAIENTKLHERVALFVLLHIKLQRSNIIWALMLSTALLSMFISNTATTSLMLPIVDAICRQIFDASPKKEEQEPSTLTRNDDVDDRRRIHGREAEDENGEISSSLDDTPDQNNTPDQTFSFLNEEDKFFREVLCLSIAYGANLGGTGSITGSPANLILPQVLDDKFPNKHSLTYATWMLMALPLAIVNLMFAWLEFRLALRLFKWWQDYKQTNTRQIESSRCECIASSRTAIISRGDGAEMISVSPIGENDSRRQQNNVVNDNSSSNSAESFDTQKPFYDSNRLNPYFDINMYDEEKKKKNNEEVFKSELQQHYQSLGEVSVSEKVVLLYLILLVLLWFFRAPKFIPGWNYLLQTLDVDGNLVKIGDATPAILVTLIAFVIPVRPIRMLSGGDDDGPRMKTKYVPLIEWSGPDGVEKRLAWGVILLLGGGFALSDGCRASGLTTWISHNIGFLASIESTFITTLVLCISIAFLTEFASNTATSAVLIPIIVDAAISNNVNPVTWALPATLSCSYAFMLPAATAPNSIVKQQCQISSQRMFTFGFIFNIIAVLNTVFFQYTIGSLIY